MRTFDQLVFLLSPSHIHYTCLLLLCNINSCIFIVVYAIYDITTRAVYLIEVIYVTYACLIQKDGVQTYFTDATTEVPYHRLSCRLPFTPRHSLSSQPHYTWTVSISNNNETFSNDEQVFVYDSKCLECQNTAISCKQKVCLYNLNNQQASRISSTNKTT